MANIAAAITYPESSANPNSIQAGQPYDTTGWGLWQITPGNSEPTIGVDRALLNPLTNAQAAVAKYKQAGNSFRPWTTYNNGAYRRYLQNGVPPDTVGAGALSVGGGNDATPGTGDTGNGTATATNASLASSIVDDVYKLFNVLGNTAVFASAILFGGILVGAGFYMLFRGTDTLSAVSAVGGPATRAVTGIGRKGYTSHVKG